MGTVDYIFECIASDERSIRSINKILKSYRKSLKLTDYGLFMAGICCFCLSMELKNQNKKIDILKQKIDILQEEVIGPAEGEQK